MKRFFKNFVFRALSVLVRIRLRRLHPFIIGVTGSVGKTSTKDAIYTILRTRYQILRNEKSYNTEFGLPLAILEQSSGFSSSWQWASILLRGLWKAFFGGYHLHMMVLEMGVDKPKDMDVLLKMVKPHIGVLTSIKPVHLGPGQFKDLDHIVQEKSKLLFALPKNGIAILNGDDPYLQPLIKKLSCKTFVYGKHEQVDLKLLEARNTHTGIQCTIQYQKEKITMAWSLPGLFQVYVVLPALAVAITQGFSLKEACEALQHYQLPAGRMNLLEGIEKTAIIDSSYNASPETMKEALGVLKDFPIKAIDPAHIGRKVAILGSMNELGEQSQHYHHSVGKIVPTHADILVTIGKEAKWIAEGAMAAHMASEHIFSFDNVQDAIAHLHTFIQENDMILVKGSQNNVRLEKFVKALLKDPSKASEVLVRQDRNW